MPFLTRSRPSQPAVPRFLIDSSEKDYYPSSYEEPRFRQPSYDDAYEVERPYSPPRRSSRSQDYFQQALPPPRQESTPKVMLYRPAPSKEKPKSKILTFTMSKISMAALIVSLMFLALLFFLVGFLVAASFLNTPPLPVPPQVHPMATHAQGPSHSGAIAMKEGNVALMQGGRAVQSVINTLPAPLRLFAMPLKNEAMSNARGTLKDSTSSGGGTPPPPSAPAAPAAQGPQGAPVAPPGGAAGASYQPSAYQASPEASTYSLEYLPPSSDTTSSLEEGGMADPSAITMVRAQSTGEPFGAESTSASYATSAAFLAPERGALKTFKTYTLHYGIFARKKAALKQLKGLKKLGFQPYMVPIMNSRRTKTFYILRVGTFQSSKEAKEASETITLLKDRKPSIVMVEQMA